ncbi:MAG TPA: hypothetical protein VF266_22830 [Thermoanaerobaculia bacterium]
MAERQFDTDVFINCPIDAAYRPLFEAIVFTIHDCGFAARSALEVTDTSQVRIEKISRIIADCKFGVHDISRTDADPVTRLPRFNMPLELGLFLGAKRFGTGKQKLKNCLVLDVERYRYQRFMSDIAGQDIVAHDGTPEVAVRVVRDWLSDAQSPARRIPGGAAMVRRYETFRAALPAVCEQHGLVEQELTFNEFRLRVEEWLAAI